MLGSCPVDVIALLNQTYFDADFLALSQEFQSIAVGVSGLELQSQHCASRLHDK
jgi:hypothetical protein